LTVTNGGVRFNETPEQWDLVPEMKSREIDSISGQVTVQLYYKEYEFEPILKVTPKGKGFNIEVHLEQPIPQELVGKACFNLEFLPSAYWNHSYIVDGKPNYFPRYAGYDTETKPLAEKAKQVNNLTTSDDRGTGKFVAPKPLAEGRKFVMAPDDPKRLITVTGDTDIQLYDGRILAQHGWFVLHSFLPADKTGKVMEWMVEPNSVSTWVREPIIGFSQVGYTPNQKKESIIELDPNDKPQSVANVYRVNEDGSATLAKAVKTTEWGQYLR
ncbi:MAG: glycoside hydrolase, partial [Bacteroidales bacterium]|nr:glycoside hydrolase [Bacteroidales bacterium]